jgi:hypothetical protein
MAFGNNLADHPDSYIGISLGALSLSSKLQVFDLIYSIRFFPSSI